MARSTCGASSTTQLRLRGFDGPARVAVFLGQFGRLFFPLIGDAPFADRDLLLLRIALLRRGDDRGIDNLAAHRQEARSPQSLIEPKEQSVDRAGLSKS